MTVNPKLPKLLVLLLAACLSLPATSLAQEEPRRSDLEERVDVRIVQINVSVTDPESDSRASVPGLTLDHFDIRIDGRRLDEARLARTSLDEICSQEVPARMLRVEDESRPPAPRPVLALVDFNYLDARGRHMVAEALDGIAASLGERGESYKVYGLTRQLRLLTPGFTKAPADVQKAAEVVRQTAFTQKPAAGMTTQEGTPDDPGADSFDLFGESDVPQDPGLRSAALLEAFEDAFALTGDSNEAAALESILGAQRESAIFGDAQSGYDPGASIAAIEGVIRAHAYLPGRKALILFSSEAFRFVRQERMNKELVATRDLARRENFTIWTVDVEGVQRRGESRSSELLSALAQDTGGDSVRRTSNLGQAFEGASEQLSCYYLLSLPVEADPERSLRRTLQIGIDTEKHPDLWRYRVAHSTSITLPTKEQRLRDDRIAVLLSPDDFDTPPVEAVIDYPRTVDDGSVLLSRFRVPLAELTWEPTEDGRVRAEILFDGVVERDGGWGSTIVCQAGTEDIGKLGLLLRRPPRADRHAGLMLELPCVFEQDGLYVTRGALTDVSTRHAGGGRATAVLRSEGPAMLTVFEPRLTAASGRDFLWRPGWEAARIDRSRSARMPAGSRVRTDDRLFLEYVLCGGDAAEDELRHVLSTTNDAGSREIFAQLPTAKAPGSKKSAGACEAVSIEIPEFTLPAGEYGLAILAPDTPAEDALGVFDGAAKAGVLAALSFDVSE